MTGLAGLLEAHRPMVSGGDDGWHTLCGCGFDELGICGAEHLAAAVAAWLADRLGSEEVREAVARALCESVNPGGFGWREHRDDWHRDAGAALAAVVGALAGEGNADSAPEAAKTAPVSDLGPEIGQGDHRDDEGRSGARDGSGDV